MCVFRRLLVYAYDKGMKKKHPAVWRKHLKLFHAAGDILKTHY